MKPLKVLTTIAGLAIAALGVLGIAAPTVLLQLGASLLTPTALYAVAAIRILFGALLIVVASASRVPKTLRVLGAVIVAAGVLTPLVGSERATVAFSEVTAQGPNFVRIVSVVALAFGLFVVYAVTLPRRNGPGSGA